MILASGPTKTKAGVGYSQKEDSFEAGVEIARMALQKTSLLQETLFFLFATPLHNIDELKRGIRSVMGESLKFLGCTTTGLVTGEFISYTGILAGGSYITSNTPFFNIFLEGNISNREFDAGKSIAQKIQESETPDDAGIVLFYDSIKVTSTEGQPELNLATPVLEGFHAQYKYWPTVAGIGAWSEVHIVNPCLVWADDLIQRHALAISTIFGPVKIDTVIMHGTRPLSGYHTITKAERNVIYEIDGKPALEVIDSILGRSVAWQDFPLFVTLGVNNGDKFGEYNEDDYASRLCFSIDSDKKTLIMFETDLVEGSEVQLMRRNIDLMYIKPQIDKLMAKVGSRKPVLALYVDCLGRVSGFSGIPEEESLEVARTLGDIPFFGVFSGVEIANVGPHVRALDWTGVLCLFSEE
jgi:hypothetical protein